MCRPRPRAGAGKAPRRPASSRPHHKHRAPPGCRRPARSAAPPPVTLGRPPRRPGRWAAIWSDKSRDQRRSAPRRRMPRGPDRPARRSRHRSDRWKCRRISAGAENPCTRAHAARGPAFPVHGGSASAVWAGFGRARPVAGFAVQGWAGSRHRARPRSRRQIWHPWSRCQAARPPPCHRQRNSRPRNRSG